MTNENLALEIMDEGNRMVESNTFGCCIYSYMYFGGW